MVEFVGDVRVADYREPKARELPLRPALSSADGRKAGRGQRGGEQGLSSCEHRGLLFRLERPGRVGNADPPVAVRSWRPHVATRRGASVGR